MKKYLAVVIAIFCMVIVYQTSQIVVNAQKPIIIVGPLCIECVDGSCDFEEIPGIAEAEHYPDFQQWSDSN